MAARARSMLSTLRQRLAGAEDALVILALAMMSSLPLVQLVGREFLGGGLPGAISIVQHLTMWISFLGAALAARSDRMLALATGSFLNPIWQQRARSVQSVVSVAIAVMLCVASVELVQVDRSFGDIAAWSVPVWIFTAVMPVGFALIALRTIWHAGPSLGARAIAALGLLLPLIFLLLTPASGANLWWPLLFVLVAATVLGMPIYAALGGLAMLLFWVEGTPLSAVPGEAYRMSTSPMLPAIPLFTLAGYILAEGGASQRLLRVFSAAVAWIPGGLALVVTLVLAFFTPLTGASGITILAMGGLLLPMLVESRYREREALGLVTVSGSIGVLFPPSLPVILYAYYAEISLDQLFLAGVLPGILLVAAVGCWAAWRGARGGAIRTPFDAKALLQALWLAKFDLALPVVVLYGIFGGFATLVEAAALTVLYAIVLEAGVFRKLGWHDFIRIGIESATMIGGFMIILSVALGLTNYLIIDQVPMRVIALVSELIQSPYAFLLVLNLLLIVVGALMDIYSAIIVIVPLIVPLAAAYGIHPVHLGIIFLANMQLGYLMPPMGENLFLASYRFERSLSELYRSVLPFIGILLAVVLLITYVPALSLWALPD
jgi:C4-dicarboxylate transporter DctM subunit